MQDAHCTDQTPRNISSLQTQNSEQLLMYTGMSLITSILYMWFQLASNIIVRQMFCEPGKTMNYKLSVHVFSDTSCWLRCIARNVWSKSKILKGWTFCSFIFVLDVAVYLTSCPLTAIWSRCSIILWKHACFLEVNCQCCVPFNKHPQYVFVFANIKCYCFVCF